MRTRSSGEIFEADAGLTNLLGNLHKGEHEERSHNRSVPSGPTLHDVSRQEVNKLLHRVRERREAGAKKRHNREGDSASRVTKRKLEVGDGPLSGQRAAAWLGSICSKPDHTADALGHGTLAKTQWNGAVLRKTQSESSSEEAKGPAEASNSNVGRVEGPVSRQDMTDDNATRDIRQMGDPEEANEFEWEMGDIGFGSHNGDDKIGSGKEWEGEVTVDLEGCAGAFLASQLRPLRRRANAKDKEFAEMIHKAHLLCMLARGRIIDTMCNDPLLQGLILSIVPPSLCLSVEAEVATTSVLGPLVNWFKSTFHVLSAGVGSSSSNKQFRHGHFLRRLRQSFRERAGSSEEVAALSVAFLRGLGFTTRYVMVLDVASLKPDLESLEASEGWEPPSLNEGIKFSVDGDLQSAGFAKILTQLTFQQVNSSHRSGVSLDDKKPLGNEESHEAEGRGTGRAEQSKLTGGEHGGEALLVKKLDSRGTGRGKDAREACRRIGPTGRFHEVNGVLGAAESESSRQTRKGDDEVGRELAKVAAATATTTVTGSKDLGEGETSRGKDKEVALEPGPSTSKKLKGIKEPGKCGKQQRGAGSSGAAFSRNSGSVKHWAEVYCSGKGMVEGWIHVDAVRGILNCADKVEAAAGSSHLPLRYIVAFAGGGAKDVTRRYVNLWSTVGPRRIDEQWWSGTLKPLKELEAIATAGSTPRTTSEQGKKPVSEPKKKISKGRASRKCKAQSEQGSGFKTYGSRGDHLLHAGKIHHGRMRSSKILAPSGADRGALEDIELELKASTEPLPTNQQAYRSHHLYALERWITKYQTLHPKGPVLGYCAGHPVYPRTSVQILHTPDRWLRQGFKVKAGEYPAKYIKASRLTGKDVVPGDEKENNTSKTTALYGKWQTEPWQPPPAVNGIVPKNERGQVDAWSDKCIPPGTVHLRLPRLVPIVKELRIDFAPAMVGFEIRKGRSIPVYEGIVVCEEFKDVILDIYDRQEAARSDELRKRKEQDAARRWWQLVQSMSTRQRLQTAYEDIYPVAIESEKHKGEIPTAKNDITLHELSTQSPADGDGIHAEAGKPGISNKKRFAEKQRRRSSDVHHVHYFPQEDETYDEESGMRTKQCLCGFSFLVEEM